MNTDSSKKCTQSNAYNWKGVMDFIKEEVKTSTNEWSHEKLMLIKKINDLEKEIKTLKKYNQELINKLNSNSTNAPPINNYNPGTNSCFTCNINSSISLEKNHKRGESDKIYTGNDQDDKYFKYKVEKSKQNSDDITKNEIFKKIVKRKTKSYGGFERMMENKLMENPLNTNRYPTINYNQFVNTNLVNGANFNNTNTAGQVRVTIQTTLNEENTNYNLSRFNSNTNFNSTKHNNKNLEFSKALANNSKLSEREVESNSNLQEGKNNNPFILDPPNYSNNLIITNVSNEESCIARNSMIFQPGNSSITSFNPNLNISTENENRRSLNNERTCTKNPLGNSMNSANFTTKVTYNPFLVLKSHFDSVRDIYLSPDKKNLVSVGEDMIINFWDFKKAIRQNKENIEPYLSLRSHTTPIFTLTGARETHQNDENIYTSGVDGIIRCTKVPSPTLDKNQRFEDTLSEICPQTWRAHQDMIWDLNYHPSENIMSSLSSDGSVKIIKGYDILNPDKSLYSFDSRSKNLIRQFTFKNNQYNFIEIPTSSYWSSKNYNHLYVSYIAPYVKLYDLESGKSFCDYNYTLEKNIPFECQQSNRIIFHDTANVLITGHEDRQIRFFDPNQNKIMKSIVAHTDSVSSLSTGLNEYEFLSASHDGSIRCWDMRIFKLLFDIPAHRKKYDEGCLSIKCYPNEKFVITCGADGLIKAFQFSI